MRPVAFAFAAALALTGTAAAVEPSSDAPKSRPGNVSVEPDGLWLGAIPGYTPATLKGATVVETAAVVELAAKNALLLDVSEPDRKPAGLPPTTIWRPQHRSIPGSVWLSGASPGDLGAAREAALKARVAALTGGDLDRPVVAFCYPDCWGSWNMGKRLVGWGYRSVHWYPKGINGWQEADQPTAVIKPDAEWRAASEAGQ